MERVERLFPGGLRERLRDHIETDVQDEVCAMRKDIRDLRFLLAQGVAPAGIHER